MPPNHYNLVFPEGYEEFEGLTESKECVTVLLTTNNREYSIYFVTPRRVTQDAEDELTRKPAYHEQNLVLVKTVDRKSILAAADFLIQSETLNQMQAKSRDSHKSDRLENT